MPVCCISVPAAAPARPLVLDKDAKTHLYATDGKPYAGCYVNASIDIWAQDSQYGKRVNAGLRGVQFIRDGDKFPHRISIPCACGQI